MLKHLNQFLLQPLRRFMRVVGQHHAPVTSLAALFTSGVALFIAYAGAVLPWVQQRAASSPNLRITMMDDSERLGWYFVSDGAGPAILEWVAIYLDGQLVDTMPRMEATIASSTGPDLTRLFIPSPIRPDPDLQLWRFIWPLEEFVYMRGRYLPAGSVKEFISFRGPSQARSGWLKGFESLKTHLRVDFCYCSTAGTCRETEFGVGRGMEMIDSPGCRTAGVTWPNESLRKLANPTDWQTPAAQN